VEILQQPHPATPLLQQGTVINDAMEQLSKIFSPPTRVETAMAVPTPRVTIPVTTTTALDRVRNRLRTKSALKNARSRQARTKSVRFTLPTTAWERLTTRLGTKSARNNARPSGLRTNSVRTLKPILEEKTTIPVGTIIRKKFKKGTLNGKISSYDKEREYYMIEYEDGDSEELRHKSVERYIVTADTKIDQLQRLTRSRLQAKTAKQIMNTMEKHHLYAVFDEATGKMLEYRHLMNHPDPEIRKVWQKSSATQMNLVEQCKE
jgi:hypothetical protein